MPQWMGAGSPVTAVGQPGLTPEGRPSPCEDDGSNYHQVAEQVQGDRQPAAQAEPERTPAEPQAPAADESAQPPEVMDDQVLPVEDGQDVTEVAQAVVQTVTSPAQAEPTAVLGTGAQPGYSSEPAVHEMPGQTQTEADAGAATAKNSQGPGSQPAGPAPDPEPPATVQLTGGERVNAESAHTPTPAG